MSQTTLLRTKTPSGRYWMAGVMFMFVGMYQLTMFATCYPSEDVSATPTIWKKITKVISWYAKVEVKNINSNYYCVGIYHTIWLTGRIKNSMKQLRLQKIYFFKNFVFGISILSPEKPWAL